jgi:imidazolonepropionase-like amidohydrolase
MIRRTSWVCPALALVTAASTGIAQDTTVFVDVNLLPMTSRAVLAHRNVTVAGGRIVSIDSGPRRMGTIRGIDGGGRYLVPGLTDAHVHLENDERRWLPVFLTYGVTTVFNLRGEPRHLTLRRDVAEGRLAGLYRVVLPRLAVAYDLSAHNRVPAVCADQARRHDGTPACQLHDHAAIVDGRTELAKRFTFKRCVKPIAPL